MREAFKQNVEGCFSRLTGNHNQELKPVKGLTGLSGTASPNAQEHNAPPVTPSYTPSSTSALSASGRKGLSPGRGTMPTSHS